MEHTGYRHDVIEVVKDGNVVAYEDWRDGNAGFIFGYRYELDEGYLVILEDTINPEDKFEPVVLGSKEVARYSPRGWDAVRRQKASPKRKAPKSE